MVYRPRFVKQFDGHRLQGTNCTMASGAMALDRQTLGKKRTTAGYLRNMQYDQEGGSDLNDLNIALARGFSESLTVWWFRPWQDLLDDLRSGRGAVLSVQYWPVEYRFRGQKNFTGGHAIYVNEARGWQYAGGVWTPTELLVGDPLCDARYYNIPQGPNWWPHAMVKKAAGALALGNGNTVGLGRCYTATTSITGEAPEVIKATGAEMITGGGIHRTSSHIKWCAEGKPLFDKPGGKIITRMSKGAWCEFYGTASGTHAVEVYTGRAYPDGQPRNTILYTYRTGTVKRKGT